MTTEIVYLGHDNTIDLILKAESVAKDLSAITKITATFKGVTIESTDKVAGVITWDQAGYDLGEIRMDFGQQSITSGSYFVPIVVYDPSNPDGVVWGKIGIQVMSEVENS